MFISYNTGIAQVYFDTGNALFRVDAFGGISLFTISGTDTLYQIDRASILVAGKPDQVFDYWNDADIQVPTSLVIPPDIGNFEITGTYNNHYSNMPPNVIVKQYVYGWNDEACSLIKFEVTNNDTAALPTIVGLDINQDIDNTWENDVIFFNADNNVFYNYENTYVGFKILSEPANAATEFSYFPEYSDNDTGYYSWLTGGINTDTLVTGLDGGVGIVGTDTVQLQPGEKRTVYMAVALGTDEASMLASMALVEGHYGAITSVNEPLATIKNYKLEQNYPNPFNPSTTISFVLPERERVSLDVYNLLGQKVVSLFNKEMEGGSHNIRFDASNLPSGIYFYTLRAGIFMSTKKMMLLK
jgi:hypothetical protein